jgi:hypothetical protein
MGPIKEQLSARDFHSSPSELPSYDSIFNPENHHALHTSHTPCMEINNALLHSQWNLWQMDSENKGNSTQIARQR